jgi:putative transposase
MTGSSRVLHHLVLRAWLLLTLLGDATCFLWLCRRSPAALVADHADHFLIHDCDATFSQELDQRVRHLGLRLLKTPVRSPQATTLYEWLLGTLRRECLDFVMPLIEGHLRHILHQWVVHDNTGRPHMALGLGIPPPPPHVPAPPHRYRQQIPGHLQVMAHPILGGFHHDAQRHEKAA